jgi:hypothetical protein
MDKNDFIKLKDEHFTYINKAYTQERWVSKDGKLYIASDDGFNYTMIHVAQLNGQGELLYDAYYKHNHSSCPIYTFEEALKVLNKLKPEVEGRFIVHPSQFRKDSDYKEYMNYLKPINT